MRAELSGQDRGGWVLAFEHEDALLEAVKRLIKEASTPWEVCAPYPCAAVRLANRHAGRGIAAGIRLWAVAGGALGFLCVAAWIYLTQFCADALVTQGRTQGADAWPAYVVPLFEGALLGAGLFTMIGFLRGAMLPKWYDPAFECEFFRTDEHGDGYFILLQGGDELLEMLKSLNPVKYEYIEPEKGGVRP